MFIYDDNIFGLGTDVWDKRRQWEYSNTAAESYLTGFVLALVLGRLLAHGTNNLGKCMRYTAEGHKLFNVHIDSAIARALYLSDTFVPYLQT